MKRLLTDEKYRGLQHNFGGDDSGDLTVKQSGSRSKTWLMFTLFCGKTFMQ